MAQLMGKPVDRWRKFFVYKWQKFFVYYEPDIFTVLDQAILVAAADRPPQEFRTKTSETIEKMYSVDLHPPVLQERPRPAPPPNNKPLDCWRENFGVIFDIFTIIDMAILVALTDHPQEFARRRRELVAKMSSAVPSAPDGVDGAVYELSSSGVLTAAATKEARRPPTLDRQKQEELIEPINDGSTNYDDETRAMLW